MTTREEIVNQFEKKFPEIKEDLTNLGYDYEQVLSTLFDEVDNVKFNQQSK